MNIRVSNLLPGAGMGVFASPLRFGPRVVFDADSNPSAEEYKTAVVGLKKATDDVKALAEKVNTEIKNLGTTGGETKLAADKALAGMNTLSATVAEMEQKMARPGGAGGHVEVKSFGAQVLDGEEVKAALAEGSKFRGRARVEVKAVVPITTGSGGGQSVSTSLVVADRVGMLALPQYPLSVRSLIAPGSTNSSAIEYPRETVFQNNAASVAENPTSPKPQSDLTFDMQNTPVRTLAHFIMASKQIMDDAPMLASIIDQRLRYGMAYVEDQQLLLGTGTGTDLKGIMPQATPYAAPGGITVQAETRIDRLRLAILQATLALLPSTGYVLHPIDWAAIELVKDSQNRYILGNPQGTLSPTLWALPVVTSFAMPVNNFLAGAFRSAAQIFDRETVNVLISTEDRDNFVKNMVTVLCEERLALAVYRPQAFVKGTFAVPGP